MMTKLLFRQSAILVLFLIGFVLIVTSQNVAITDDDAYSANASAMLDIKSINKGLLVPRVALVSTVSPISVTKPSGLLVWNTSTTGTYNKVGFYFWNGADWEMVGSNNTFTNGLTQSGTSIKLGGTLVENTTISQGNFAMTYNLTGTGDFDIQDNGASSLFVGDNGNVGIGKNNPLQKLDVNGNLKIGDNLSIEGTSSYGKYRNLATYSAGSTTGAFVINTNQVAYTMFVIKITGFFYSNTGPYEVTIKGYWNGQCYNGGYTSVGPDDLQVRVGKNSGGAMVIILGNETSTYSIPKITVTDYYQGFGAINEAAADGWAITQATDLTAYANVVVLKNSAMHSVNGNTTNIDDPIFEVKNNLGQTVFGVYNEGVRIWVNDDPLKATGSRGGFAVGGISGAKGITNEFLRVTPDSVRVYIDETATKPVGSRGGFAVGGISGAKATITDMMRLTKNNYFIGHNSGVKTTGLYNLFLGYESGRDNVAGNDNTFLGYLSGQSNIGGHNNVFVGDHTGISNLSGNYNAFVGSEAGYANTSGQFNTFIGHQAGRSNTTAGYNTIVGYHAGYTNTISQGLAFFGYKAGHTNTGKNNTYIGNESGYNSDAGEYNTCLGSGTGRENTGSYNVFLGYAAGFSETGSNKLIIENSQSWDANYYPSNALVYGDFLANTLQFNANIGVNTAASSSYGVNIDMNNTLGSGYGVLSYGGLVGVYGNASGKTGTTAYGIYGSATGGTTNWAGYFSGNVYASTYSSSDIRMKKNIITIPDALSKLNQISGVYYEWDKPAIKMLKGDGEINSKKDNIDENKLNEADQIDIQFKEGQQIGIIAQEVEVIMPEAVITDSEGLKSVDYSRLIPLLIEAVKEQELKINTLETKLLKQQKELEALKTDTVNIKDLQQQLIEINTLLKLNTDIK